MKSLDLCPECGSNQQGPPIPEEYLREGMYGEWNGEPRFYSRTILVEIRGVYDGGLFYQCPDCGHRWHRWPENHSLFEVAVPYMRAEANVVHREAL